MVTFIQTQSHITYKTSELTQDELPGARGHLKAGEMDLTTGVHFRTLLNFLRLTTYPFLVTHKHTKLTSVLSKQHCNVS